jgi:uncharacterized protein YyaL (SSP411 family)
MHLLIDKSSGRLNRSFRSKPSGWGFSEDYSLLIQSIIELFAITGKKEYLEKAIELQIILDDHFWDEDSSGYFFTGSWQNDTFVREKPVITFSIPNANAISLTNLLKLHHYTGERRYLERSEELVGFLLSWFERYETFNGESLLSLNMYQDKPVECIVFSEKPLLNDDSILTYLRSTFIPNLIFLKVTKDNFFDLNDLPLVRDRIDNSTEYPFSEETAYICKKLTCSVPLKNGTETDLYLNEIQTEDN